ncbi:MAG: peptidoglycan-binding domain-containing protein [Blastocatellia bacterium]
MITPANYPVVPDRVEVLEYGSSESSDLGRRPNTSAPRSQTAPNSAEAALAATAPRKRVKIESSRVLQIQQALSQRGFYGGEMTGVYDEATVDAMRRFQASQKISVTGYPTAHALKRLGLAN